MSSLAGNTTRLAESRHLAARLRQKVTPEIAQIALDALLRRDRLDPAARLAIFGELAAYFRALVPYPPDLVEQLADEQYVRNVVEILYRPLPGLRQPCGSRTLAPSSLPAFVINLKCDGTP